MSTFFFHKYQATGNDFVLMDNQKQNLCLSEKQIRWLCDRNKGIGADGVIFIEPSSKADFRMRIFNRDGKEAAMCGNGFFCLMKWIKDHLGWQQKSITIETKEKIYLGLFEPQHQIISFGSFLLPKKIDLTKQSLYYSKVGVAHSVLFVEDLSSIAINKEAKKFRHHPFFGNEGTNVSFVEKKGEKLLVKVFEKGVEDQTKGCGTAAVAIALASFVHHNISSPITLFFPGGELKVQCLINLEMAKDVKLFGFASTIFSGKVELDLLSTQNKSNSMLDNKRQTD